MIGFTPLWTNISFWSRTLMMIRPAGSVKSSALRASEIQAKRARAATQKRSIRDQLPALPTAVYWTLVLWVQGRLLSCFPLRALHREKQGLKIHVSAVRFRPQPHPSQVVAAGPSRTGIVSGGKDLFRAQRSNRIHIRCAARGKKTGEQRGSGEHET